MNRTDRVLHNPDRSCATYTEAAPQLTEKGRLPISRSVFKRQCEPSGAMTDVARCVFVHTGTERRQRRETDLSAEQAGAQAPPWVPRAHGYHGRPQGDRSPPGAWPQTPQRLIRSGAAEAASRFPRCRDRDQGADRGLRVAGSPAGG